MAKSVAWIVGLVVLGLVIAWVSGLGEEASTRPLSEHGREATAVDPPPIMSPSRTAQLDPSPPATDALARPERLEASVPAAHALRGRVVTAAGAPVAGARVHLVARPPPVPARVGFGQRSASSWSETLDSWWDAELRLDDLLPTPRLDLVPDVLADLPQATSDGDGAFRLDFAWPGAPTTSRATPFLMALHPDFAPTFERVDLSAVGSLDDIVLSPGVTVRGRAVDAQGRPVEGASVRLGREWTFAVALRTATGPGGAFVFSQVPSGDHELRLEHPGHASNLRGHVEFEVDTDLGDIVLADGGPIAGRVLDAAGRPVQRAHVFVTTEPIDSREMHPINVDFEPDHDSILLEFGIARHPRTGHALTDAEGRFRIDDRPLENHVLYARHPDHEPARRRDVLPGHQRDVPLDARVDRFMRVMGERGEPVAALDLRAWRLVERSGGRRIPVELADAALGVYRVEGVGFRETYLTASAPGFADERWRISPEEFAGVTVLERTLAAGYAIDALVVDEDGAPLEDWNLSVTAADSQAVGFGGQGTGPTHRFEGLPAGDYEVHAWTRSIANDRIRPRSDVLSLGADSPAVSCTLVAPVGAKLAGTISSPDPEPQWFSVQLVRPGATPSPNDPRGRRNRFSPDRYSVTAVEPGAWSVLIDGRDAGTVTLVAGETTQLDLQVPAQARIEGLVWAGAVPLAGARVQARYVGDRGAAQQQVSTDTEGGFVLRLPLAGPWEVGAVAAGASKYAKPWSTTRVEVPEHGMSACELRLPVGRLRLRVLREDGQPAASRSVWLLRDPEGAAGPRSTDEHGEVVFDHLPAGRWRGKLRRSGSWAAALGEWTAVADDDWLVAAPQLVVARGLTIHVEAFVSPGVPAPVDAQVRLWDATADAYLESRELDQGQHAFEGLSPGAYRLALFRGDEGLYEEDTGALGTLVQLVDTDVEVTLIEAVDDAP